MMKPAAHVGLGFRFVDSLMEDERMRTWFWMLASLVALAYAAPAEAGHRGRACGGCTPPPCLQVQTAPCYTVVSQPVAMTTVSAPAVPSCVVVSEPWKDLRVVLALPAHLTKHGECFE